jgi:Mrp family chromosome partitioning ATPase
MSETLKLGEGRRTPLPVSKPTDAAPVQDCVVDWEIGNEVPFVEVGGPGRKIEVSPGLMPHPPQGLPQAPHLPIEPPVKAKAVKLAEPKPLSAAFEPWPPLAPPAEVSPEIIAYHHPDHPASQDYAALLETMRRGLKTDGRVLLLVGLKPGVGTSTVLLNLAVCAARDPQMRVAVVDLNGGLAARLGQPAPAGFLDVLDGKLALEQAMVKTGIGGLHLLPAASADGQPTPLTGAALTWLIAWQRARYDLILIDGPTLEAGDHLAVPAPLADGVYLVLPQGETPKGIAPPLGRLGGRLCGLIYTHLDV